MSEAEQIEMCPLLFVKLKCKPLHYCCRPKCSNSANDIDYIVICLRTIFFLWYDKAYFLLGFFWGGREGGVVGVFFVCFWFCISSCYSLLYVCLYDVES